MKKILYYSKMITLSFMLICCLTAFSQSSTTVITSQSNIEKWITRQFGRHALPPFSFQYDGVSSSSFIKSWNYSAQKLNSNNPRVVKYRFVYEKKNEIKVEAEVNGYLDFNTVDWMLHFTNTGVNNTKEISNVKVSDISFVTNDKKNVQIHYSNGSMSAMDDFMPHQKTLAPNDEPFTMIPKGGRSSAGVLPFFNVEINSHQGVLVGIGWTGTWFASLTPKSKQLNLATGIERLRTFLYPQESIRTSSICLSFWEGEDRFAGHNQFRRFIRAHRTRIINGKPVDMYPLFNGFNWGDPEPCNEYTCLTTEYATFLIHRWKQFDLNTEAIWLDAGWYTEAGNYKAGKNWANTVGNWKIDKTRFPDGFKTISNEAHKAGMKFMVWFEPERVYYDSDWAIEHPEWMLKMDDSSKNYLFNLGNADACQWLSKYIGDFMEENGIDHYRQDFNIAPEKFWTANDEKGREGMCEIRYIEGLYNYWDYLLNRFPELLIDNCASGGNRLDYETTLRSAPMWRTDYGYGVGVDGYQSQTYGLNLYLPFSATGVYATDPYHFRSSISSSAVFNWKLTTNETSFLEMQRCYAELKELRPYFTEDFYPLSGINDLISDQIWLAYELFRPSDETGFVLAFRRENSKEKDYVVHLQGLKDQQVYQIINRDTNEVIEKTGAELKEKLVLTLEKPESCVLLQIKRK